MMQHRKPLKSSPPPPPITPSSPAINLKQFPRLKPILISMAALLSLALILFFAVSAARHHKPADPYPDLKNYSLIGEVCKASRDPTACRASLSEPGRVPPNATVLEAIQSALWVSSKNLDSGRGMVQSILDASAASPTRSNAARSCLEFLRYSEHRISSAAAALPRGELKDARAWMSASLVYQYDCWSALKYVNDTAQVNKTMAFFYSSVIGTSSNSMGMMVNYDVFGEKTQSWGPVKTERDGFWEHVGPKSPSGPMSVPTGLKVDVTVCNEGDKCDFKTVQEAVNAGPDNSTKKFVIQIKTGVYEETVRVPLEKRNVVMLGDGIGKSVITGSMSVDQDGMSTYNSATVGVVGDGFMAKDLTFQNTAGPIAHQAVAFRSDSDQSIVENCEFLGNQDTLYAHSLRQYYKSCLIQGNVDFIFGNSASFFQDCLILIAPRQVKPEKGEKNAVTAHGRIDPAQSTGFVFQNCVVNGTDGYMSLYHKKPSVHRSYLGRPWKEYSRTVFLGCVLEVVVMGEGWMPWSGDFALKTLFYGEFENRGVGSDVSRRVSWSSQVPAEFVSAYSVENFIQGDKWVNLVLNS